MSLSIYDIQFVQAKFVKKNKKGRKKKEDSNKENVDVIDASKVIDNSYLYQFHYDQFVSQRATYFAINKFIVDYNNSIFINNQNNQQQLLLQQQQQFYTIFSHSPSILLAKPQTIKKGRSANRTKKEFKCFKFGII
jgi:hypothetical protein